MRQAARLQAWTSHGPEPVGTRYPKSPRKSYTQQSRNQHTSSCEVNRRRAQHRIKEDSHKFSMFWISLPKLGNPAALGECEEQFHPANAFQSHSKNLTTQQAVERTWAVSRAMANLTVRALRGFGHRCHRG
eukprot:g29602.t1